MAVPLKYQLILEVDEIEREKLKGLLQEHNLIQCLTAEKVVKTVKEKVIKKRKVEESNRKDSGHSSGGHGGGGGGDGDGENPGNYPEQQDGRCPHCFLNPCIAHTNRSATWLGNGQRPSNDNPGVRKGIYKRFWKCINNVYGWHLPDYLEKKKRIGGGEWVVMHQREVMPECVLEHVRNLYPNPEGIPYLGHKWE